MSVRRTQRRLPLGRPLPKTQDENAEVTIEDVERARQVAERIGNETFNAMVNAEPVEQEEFDA